MGIGGPESEPLKERLANNRQIAKSRFCAGWRAQRPDQDLVIASTLPVESPPMRDPGRALELRSCRCRATQRPGGTLECQNEPCVAAREQENAKEIEQNIRRDPLARFPWRRAPPIQVAQMSHLPARAWDNKSYPANRSKAEAAAAAQGRRDLGKYRLRAAAPGLHPGAARCRDKSNSLRSLAAQIVPAQDVARPVVGLDGEGHRFGSIQQLTVPSFSPRQ
jgi:hypothetical protein